jgi:hypothetical protein
LNGFGFGLENYNAAGHYQMTDNGLPVDATGTISGTDVDGPFTGGVALANILAGSEVVYRCAVQQWLRFALGRAPADGEQAEVSALTRAFMQSHGDVRALLVDLALSPSFRMKLVEDD